MAVILENSKLRAVINEHGAELVSLLAKDTQIQYMWSGDSKYWGRHSPVLFPIEGRVKDDTYQIDGKSYHLTQHGFARDMDFMVIEQTETSACFELRATKETKQKYPYDFVLQLAYQLDDNGISVTYRVVNPMEETIYFGIGAHPAFSTKLELADQYTDYEVQISPAKKRLHIPLKDGYLDLDQTALKDTDLAVSHELFKDDAIIYNLEQEPAVITLKSKKHGHGVSIEADDAKAVGIWSCYPAKGDFVCLEPWWALSDPITADGDFKHKYAINELAATGEFKTGFKINVF